MISEGTWSGAKFNGHSRTDWYIIGFSIGPLSILLDEKEALDYRLIYRLQDM